MSDLNLANDFPPSTDEAWQALVEKGLRGSDFATLIKSTEDGLPRGPLMTADDLPEGLAALGRTDMPLLEGRAWHIAAPVRDPDLARANRQLLEDLKGGASAVRIEAGATLKDRNDLKRLLEGVYTDLVPLQFAPNSENAARFAMALSIKDLQTAHLQIGLGPLEDANTVQAVLSDCPENWRLMSLAPSDVHEAGGTEVQALSVMAASLAESMRRHGVDAMCRHLSIDLSTDRDAHLTITKFRAARRLILRIAEAFGGDGSNIPLHAVTSGRMMQRTDAWTNLLRIMSAGFGAVIGGADVITIRPFTDGLGKATPFAHRIARNMQLLMMEESHLGQVTDAAYGSYWHEHMTDALAQAAWAKFQDIERIGGVETYLNSDTYSSDLATAQGDRDARAEPILGVTLHSAEGVKVPEVRA
ncbi:methylmalonyl-CoA mutase family protein [Litorimonas sp. WD9-15]|uniref:methylmalonyl-CoA mutase family protein n=1 Tax=Litorimonas sp. WD9-15 TaxID=3418716 RepID=UPI003D00A25C